MIEITHLDLGSLTCLVHLCSLSMRCEEANIGPAIGHRGPTQLPSD